MGFSYSVCTRCSRTFIDTLIQALRHDYRGEIKVALLNTSNEPYTVSPFERIAQLVIVPYLKAEFEEADELSDTERGEGGFGSTGRK